LLLRGSGGAAVGQLNHLPVAPIEPAGLARVLLGCYLERPDEATGGGKGG